jgi:hypothetical protein
MPKGFNLKCAAGKTARVWLRGKADAVPRSLVSLQIAPPSSSNLHDFVAAARRKYFPRLGWTPALWVPYGVALR